MSHNGIFSITITYKIVKTRNKIGLEGEKIGYGNKRFNL